MLRVFVGVLDAMNHGDGREHGEHPQHGRHGSPMIEERTQKYQHDAFGALHESHLALTDQSLGACTGIAHHERGDHDKGDQDDVAESVDAPVVDEQAEEEHHVGVAVDDGIEERTEDCDLVGSPRYAAVDHVEDARAKDHERRVEEHAVGVACVGMSEEKRRDDVDDQADEGQHIGRDLGECQAMHDSIEEPAAGAAESTGPGHLTSLLLCAGIGLFFVFVVVRFVVDGGQFQDLEFPLAVRGHDAGGIADHLAHQSPADWGGC